MIELSERDLATIRRILAEHVPDCEVRAFGSRVIGPVKPWSDLDLVVAGRTALALERLGRLKEAFEECDVPIRVDVLDWNRIGPEFHAVIRAGSVMVQESPHETSAPHSRPIQPG